MKNKKIIIVILLLVALPRITLADPIPMMPIGPFSALQNPLLFSVYIFFGSIVEILIALFFALIFKLANKGKIILSVLFSNLIFYPFFWFFLLPVLNTPRQPSISGLPPSSFTNLSSTAILIAEIFVVIIEFILIYIFCNYFFRIQLSKKNVIFY